MISDQFFFCFGLPKSGTTLLQRILNMHPSVSCPSEQDLEFLIGNFVRLIETYNGVLRVADRRTGGQGATLVSSDAEQELLREIVCTISRGYAAGKPVHGLNENSVVERLKYYDELFDNPKMICIIRNPVDRATSAWHHAHRLAEWEKDMAEQHLALLENPENSLEGYIKLKVKEFPSIIDRYVTYAGDRTNFLTVLYERLVNDKKNEINSIFEFLGAEACSEVLADIESRSARNAMAAASSWPAFFGIDRDRQERPAVTSQFRSEMLESCRDALHRIGYEIADLLVCNQDSNIRPS